MRLINRKLIGGGGGGGYDTDAADYFTRAEALGGSFDQSGSGYSEATVKQAISDFVATCKTDGTWSKITEAYLLAGVTFAGLTAKLKYLSTDTLTNNGFVSGDYTAVGSGGGLQGDNSSYLITGLVLSNLTYSNLSYSAYLTTDNGDSTAGFIGAASPYSFLGNEGTGAVQFSVSASGDAVSTSTTRAGMFVGSSRSSIDRELYRNGTSIAIDTSSTSPTYGSQAVSLFALSTSFTLNARMSFASVGTGLTDTEAADLSDAVNTLMTALGCNVF